MARHELSREEAIAELIKADAAIDALKTVIVNVSVENGVDRDVVTSDVNLLIHLAGELA